jgi:copper(I)-binding protein
VIRSRLATAAPRRLLVLAIVGLIAVLAGCEAGNNSPVDDWHPSTAGADSVVQDISISNVFVLGPEIGQTLPAGGSAGVFLALFNNGSKDDTLQSVTAPGTAKSVMLPGGGVVLAPQRSVLLTGPQPEIILNGLTRPLAGGTTVLLRLTFVNSGTDSLTVPVMPRAEYYSTYSPPATPSPTPTAKAKVSPSPKATPSPTPTPSGSASPSPTP